MEPTAEHFIEVQACFFQKVSTKEILKKNSEWFKTLTVGDQEKLMEFTILSDTCLSYPVANDYQLKFLKGWIQMLEDSAVEISDVLYESYGNLISSGKHEDELNYKTFMLRDGPTLILEESTLMTSHGTTGLQMWPAAYWLAEWVLENKQIFSDKSVLELGCGIGFTGLIACATCNINQYVFTDWHNRVLQSLHSNLKLNLKQRRHINAAFCEQCSSKLEESDRKLATLCTVLKRMPSSCDSSKCNGCFSAEVDVHKISPKTAACLYQQNCGDCRMDRSDKLPLNSSSSQFVKVDDNHLCESVLTKCSSSMSEQQQIRDVPITRNKVEETGGEAVLSHKGNLKRLTVVHLASLDWEQEDSEVKELLCPDIVLAADVIFEPKLIQPLTRTLKGFLGRTETSVAFIASSVRNQETYNQFLAEIDLAGITSEELAGPALQVFHYDRSCPIKLLKLHAGSG